MSPQELDPNITLGPDAFLPGGGDGGGGGCRRSRRLVPLPCLCACPVRMALTSGQVSVSVQPGARGDDPGPDP